MLKLIRLTVTRTTLGLWFSARTECDASILRGMGFPPAFDEASYERLLTAASETPYGVETEFTGADALNRIFGGE